MADTWELETEEPQLWNHPRSKLKEDNGKIYSYKKSAFITMREGGGAVIYDNAQ